MLNEVKISTSPLTVGLFGFQQMILLSLELDISKLASFEYQLNMRTPRWWPSSWRTGAVANRRSQICKCGVWSSSLARHIWVATSGFQATSLARIFDIESLTLIMLSFLRKSHTTHLPPADVDARMCCTWLFHDRHCIASSGCSFAPLNGFYYYYYEN